MMRDDARARYMRAAFAKGSPWAVVLNQGTGETGRVPLSFVHLFDALPHGPRRNSDGPAAAAATTTRAQAERQVDTFWTQMFEDDYRQKLGQDIKVSE